MTTGTTCTLRLPVLSSLLSSVVEGLERFVGQSAFLALVDEIVRAVVSDADANGAALDHLVEVAGERLVQHLLNGIGQRIVGRLCRWYGFIAACGRGAAEPPPARAARQLRLRRGAPRTAPPDGAAVCCPEHATARITISTADRRQIQKVRFMRLVVAPSR